MRAAAMIRLVVAGLAMVSMTGVAWAQVQIGGVNIEGQFEAGGRIFIERPSKSERAKFEEYRDLPPGLFLDQFHLGVSRPDTGYSAEFEGTKWGQDDQQFTLRAGRIGLWEFGFQWDQTPHVYSTDARTLLTEASPGVFTLPTPRPSPLTLYNTPPNFEISQQWDTARLWFGLTPTPDLDLKTEYARIHKDGDKPFSMAFGSPGNNFLQILEPIDQTVNDYRLRLSLARENYQLQFTYAFSQFSNDLTSVTADNPCFGLPAALPAGCGTTDGGAAAPATGRTSLPPSNIAHTFSFAGGANLPWWRTRVNANFSYGIRFQNEDFLPHTINPTISSPLLTLPQSSLDGFVQTFLGNVSVTSRPLPPLTLSLKYRIYDFDDQSDQPTFAGFVLNDRTLVPEERQAGRFTYIKQNAELDARWRFAQALAATLGFGWENWNRNVHREVRVSNEYGAKAAVDWTPLDWVLVRAAYTPSFRRIDQYNTFAHLAHEVTEEELADATLTGQSTLLRKFDEADRNRQQVNVFVDLTPLPFLTVTPFGSYRYDDYYNSPLGLQQVTSWSAGVDFAWTPVERVTIFGGYVYEQIDQKQESRSRPVAGTPPTALDFPDFDWVSKNKDFINTFRLGVNTTLIPNVLTLVTTASYEAALGKIDTSNPVPPTSGTPAQNLTATAKPFPNFWDSLIRLDTALKYRFWKGWSATLAYAFEKFQKGDFRTDGLTPFVPGVSSIFLGNDLKDYTAHIIAVKLGYQFQ